MFSMHLVGVDSLENIFARPPIHSTDFFLKALSCWFYLSFLIEFSESSSEKTKNTLGGKLRGICKWSSRKWISHTIMPVLLHCLHFCRAQFLKVADFWTTKEVSNKAKTWESKYDARAGSSLKGGNSVTSDITRTTKGCIAKVCRSQKPLIP